MILTARSKVLIPSLVVLAIVVAIAVRLRPHHPPQPPMVAQSLATYLSLAPEDSQLMIRVDTTRDSLENLGDTLAKRMGPQLAQQAKLAALYRECGSEVVAQTKEALVTFGAQVRTTAMLRGPFDSKKLEECLARFCADNGPAEEWEGLKLYAGAQGRRFAILPGALFFGDPARLKAQIQLIRNGGRSMADRLELAPRKDLPVAQPMVLALIPDSEFRTSALGALFEPLLDLKAVVATADLDDDLIHLSATALTTDPVKASTLATLLLPTGKQPASMTDISAPAHPEIRVGIDADGLRVEAAVESKLIATYFEKSVTAKAHRKQKNNQ
jgi:hypothetical protein